MAVLLSACAAADSEAPPQLRDAAPVGGLPSLALGLGPPQMDLAPPALGCAPRAQTVCGRDGSSWGVYWEDGCGARGERIEECPSGWACDHDGALAWCEPSCAETARVCMGDDIFVQNSCLDEAVELSAGTLVRCAEGYACLGLGYGRAECTLVDETVCLDQGETACFSDFDGVDSWVAATDTCGRELDPVQGCMRYLEWCVAYGGEAECLCMVPASSWCDGDVVMMTAACDPVPTVVETCVAPARCVEAGDEASCSCSGVARVGCADGDVQQLDDCGLPTERLVACAAGDCVESGPNVGCGGVVVDRTPYPTGGGVAAGGLLSATGTVLVPGPGGATLQTTWASVDGRPLAHYWSCALRVGEAAATAPAIWTGTLSESGYVAQTLSGGEAWGSAEGFAAAPCGELRALFMTCEHLGVPLAAFSEQPILLEKVCP